MNVSHVWTALDKVIFINQMRNSVISQHTLLFINLFEMNAAEYFILR